MEIPFRAGEIVCAPHFAGRRSEVTQIRQAMWRRGRLLVTGERGEGKRSAVEEAFSALRSRGGLFLRVDLWTAEGPLDILRRLVARVPQDWPRSTRLHRMLAGAGLQPVEVAGPDGPRLGLDVRGVALRSGEAMEHLQGVVAFLDQMAATHPSPMVVGVDRVQRDGPEPGAKGSLLAGLMAEAQHLSWILTGTFPWTPDEPEGGSVEVPRLHLESIPESEMAPWIASRFRDHGVEPAPEVPARILELAGPRTAHRVQLARATYLRGLGREQVEAGVVDQAFEGRVREGADAYELLWQELAPYQRSVVRAVAAGVHQLHSRDASLEYDLPVSSAITKAVQILREKGYFTQEAPVAPWDPFFAAWVREHAMIR